MIVGGSARAGVSDAWVRRIVRSALRAVRKNRAAVSVTFVTDAKIAGLNSTYRKKRGPTDVLSFQAVDGDDLGDIFISPASARRRAKLRGMTYRNYLALLIVHGVLHLAGFDHASAKDAKKMERLESRILNFESRF
jgi:probable rRNA maturation factor